MKNRGTEFEKRLQKIHGVYSMMKVAKIEKVAPPSLVIKGKFILMRNPFLDFAGTWTECHGRALFIEGKLTETPSIRICQAGGLSENQYSNLWAWKDAGAAVGLIWFYTEANTIKFVPLSTMASYTQQGIKSMRWEAVPDLPPTNRCPWDYLPVLKKELAGT